MDNDSLKTIIIRKAHAIGYLNNHRSILIFLLMISILTNSMAAKKITNPLYTIEFKIVGTGAEISINDIPVHINTATGTTKSEIQIPQYIKNGENELKTRTFPLEGDNNKYREGAYVDISLLIRGKDDPTSNSKTISQFRINPTLPLDHLFDGTNENHLSIKPKLLKQTDGEFIANITADLKTDFSNWAWFTGNPINQTLDNYNSLVDKYREVHHALKFNDKNKLKEIYKYAASELSNAYHHSDIESGFSLLSSDDFITDSKWELLDIDELLNDMDYKLEILAYGKLARLVQEDGDSPIIFIHEDDLVSVIPFLWYKNSSNEWIMIR